jgi:hypothetical protein
MTSSSSTTSAGIGSPISNPAYNVISALQAKLEGMEAFRKFAQSDGNEQLWQRLTELDTQAVQLLTTHLEQMAQSGELRLHQAGQTGRRS